MSRRALGVVAGCSLFVTLAGCGGAAAGTDPNDDPPSTVGVTSDCAGCSILLKGIVQPYAPYLVGSNVYVEDWGAGKLLRVPLSGGAPITVSQGRVNHVFAITSDELFFWAPEPADEAYDSVFRVSLADAEPTPTIFARFEHERGTPCGIGGGVPLLRGVADDGTTVLYSLGEGGTLKQLRKWATIADSPTGSAFAVLPGGQLLWGDRKAGLWAAAAPDAEAEFVDTGFLAAIVEIAGANTLVANYQPEDSEGKSRIFSSDSHGGLTEIVATTGERIGSPVFVVPGGVVAVSRETGRLMLIKADGSASVFASSMGKLSMNPEGLAATDEDVVFIANSGPERWALYRVAAP